MSNKINEICHAILTITDKEIEEMREIIEGQKNYTHPFKQELQDREYTSGENNEFILNSLIETKRLLVAAEPK